MGLEEDLLPGEQLIALFRPFLEHLAVSDLSPKTIQKHVDKCGLWAASSFGTSTMIPLSERSRRIWSSAG
jgi:hypothetical protein